MKQRRASSVSHAPLAISKHCRDALPLKEHLFFIMVHGKNELMVGTHSIDNIASHIMDREWIERMTEDIRMLTADRRTGGPEVRPLDQHHQDFHHTTPRPELPEAHLNAQYIAAVLAAIPAMVREHSVEVKEPLDVWKIPEALNSLYSLSPPGRIDVHIKELFEVSLASFMKSVVEHEIHFMILPATAALQEPIPVQRAIVQVLPPIAAMMFTLGVLRAKDENSMIHVKNLITMLRPIALSGLPSGTSKKAIMLSMMGECGLSAEQIAEITAWNEDEQPVAPSP